MCADPSDSWFSLGVLVSEREVPNLSVAPELIASEALAKHSVAVPQTPRRWTTWSACLPR